MTVLVLTPGVGGHYFGELVAGLSREVAAAGGRILLVQTLDGGIRADEESELSSFATPVAWDHIDGAVSITTAVHGAHLQRLRDAGIPVVLASTKLAGFEAPLVLPDNHGGTLAAVEHLIGHGHTRIGFVGNVAHPDVGDRYAAYTSAMTRHGLGVDPALLFPTASNDFSGGAGAANDIVTSDARPTALMVATDRNAIGLMRALTAAGLAIPADLAVVGFDNMEEAAFSSPPLTSVGQRFDDVGALAGRLILAQIRGEDVSFTAHVPPPAPLAVRDSCGCTAAALGIETGGPTAKPHRSTSSLRDDLRLALSRGLMTGQALDAVGDAIAEIAVHLDGWLYGTTVVTDADVRWLTESLHRLTSRPAVLRQVVGLVTVYIEQRAAAAESVQTPRADLWALTVALWKMQAGAFLTQAETTRIALHEQYVVDARMLTVGESDPRHLGWLADTHVVAGALALWEGDALTPQLRLTGTYGAEATLAHLVGSVTTVEQFPPEALISAAPLVDGAVCIVVPVCTRDRNWGLLAVVGKFDTTSALESYRQWADQLCASFEAHALQTAVRDSEQRYALAARASNDGMWERDLRTQDVYLSDRCLSMLGIESSPAEDRHASWVAHIHPEDLATLRAAMDPVIAGDAETASCEYRVEGPDGTYRWVLSRALGVRLDSGVVERIVGSLSDVHERHSLEDQLRENALFDALTGLPNRRLFLSRLEQAVALSNRAGTPFAVIFLDLDGFKAINDSLGHQMGDRVLTEVGARIRKELREVDTGARFGGDEFAILLQDSDHAGALVLAERVTATLADVIHLDGHDFTIGASVGVATSAVSYASAEDVLRDADTAMYRAKESQPGTVSFFDSEMHALVVRELRLNAELRRALDEQQFELRYQPIVNLVTGHADRFEALVRWRHPERGLVMPDEFLPAMAESGAIIQLGRWAINEVCRQLAAWGPDVANVAVNVSDREFWHGDLLNHVLAALTRHNLTADRLTVEFTEGVIMRAPDVAIRMTRAMHDAGLQLHIDDFGTGYSSLETLHRFPVDAFKVDRSFIAALTTSDRSNELVRAIIAMGKALNLDVIAEGVETEDQLRFLQEIGCLAGQGFLFMPAVSGEHAPTVLGRVLGTSPNRTRSFTSAPEPSHSPSCESERRRAG